MSTRSHVALSWPDSLLASFPHYLVSNLLVLALVFKLGKECLGHGSSQHPVKRGSAAMLS